MSQSATIEHYMLYRRKQYLYLLKLSVTVQFIWINIGFQKFVNVKNGKMEAAKVNHQQKKRSFTTRINTMHRYIAEECEIDHLKDKRDQLKAAFAGSEQCHQTY